MIWTTRPRSEGAGALSFFEEGTGPALVLIHGVGLRAEAWLAMVPALARQYRVVCVDMPGHGASPLAETSTCEDYVARFAAFTQALDAPVGLIGHSMGALIALELAAADPNLVSAVAALNTVHRRMPAAAEAVRARARALSDSTRPDPEPTLKRWFGDAPTGAEAQAADACRHWLTAGSIEGYAAAYRVFAERDGASDAALARLRCPALFLTGARDPNSTETMSQALASATSAGQAAVLGEAAHMLPMTHGKAALAHIIPFLSTAFGAEAQSLQQKGR